jgi:hypothetical protein
MLDFSAKNISSERNHKTLRKQIIKLPELDDQQHKFIKSLVAKKISITPTHIEQ